MKIINTIPPKVGKGEFVAMDCEFYGQEKDKLHRPTGTFACLSVCVGTNVYQIYDSKQVRAVLAAVGTGTWVFHNALYDLRQLQRYAVIKPRSVWDTMLVDQSMYGSLYQTFSLGDLSRRWLGQRMLKDVRTNFATATKMTAEMKTYAAKDAIKTLAIAKLQQATFADDPAFKAYLTIDEPMIWPILDMPGVPVDAKLWKETVVSFRDNAAKVEEELGFNVKSPQQCHTALRKVELHLQDTGAKTLATFKSNPLVALIIKGRLYRDAVSKYGENWLEKNIDEDGLVYSSYHITGAETGRMSSSNPNMQNIPARVLPVYRTFFIASPGNVIIVSDISQQEPRILAYESKDAELMGIFQRGEDSHLAVTRIIFNDPTIQKDDPRRSREGKTVNLGLSYGLSEYGLAVQLNITEQEAANYIRQYFLRFRDVFLWVGQQRSFAYRTGYVKTASGRKIHMNLYDRGWENNAINAPIQGGAADFTKMWVRKIWEGCRKTKVPYLLDRVVHDEIVMNVPRAMKKTYVDILKTAFRSTADTLYKGVPFEEETAIGRSWGIKQLASEADVEVENDP